MKTHFRYSPSRLWSVWRKSIWVNQFHDVFRRRRSSRCFPSLRPLTHEDLHWGFLPVNASDISALWQTFAKLIQNSISRFIPYGNKNESQQIQSISTNYSFPSPNTTSRLTSQFCLVVSRFDLQVTLLIKLSNISHFRWHFSQTNRSSGTSREGW